MTRRGFMLIELLVGLVMLALLGVAVTSTLAMSSRSTTRALDRLVTGRSITATAALLREELGHATLDEIQLLGGGAMDFSRTIGTASVCAVAGNTVLLRQSEWEGVRDPEAARDEANLLIDPAAATWTRIPIAAVGAGSCPDGAPGIQLQLGANAGGALLARISEPVRLRGYTSGGNGWWGLMPGSGGSPVQPFSGPFASPVPDPDLRGTTLELRFRPAGSRDTILRFPLGGS